MELSKAICSPAALPGVAEPVALVAAEAVVVVAIVVRIGGRDAVLVMPVKLPERVGSLCIAPPGFIDALEDVVTAAAAATATDAAPARPARTCDGRMVKKKRLGRFVKLSPSKSKVEGVWCVGPYLPGTTIRLSRPAGEM